MKFNENGELLEITPLSQICSSNQLKKKKNGNAVKFRSKQERFRMVDENGDFEGNIGDCLNQQQISNIQNKITPKIQQKLENSSLLMRRRLSSNCSQQSQLSQLSQLSLQQLSQTSMENSFTETGNRIELFGNRSQNGSINKELTQFLRKINQDGIQNQDENQNQNQKEIEKINNFNDQGNKMNLEGVSFKKNKVQSKNYENQENFGVQLRKSQVYGISQLQQKQQQNQFSSSLNKFHTQQNKNNIQKDSKQQKTRNLSEKSAESFEKENLSEGKQEDQQLQFQKRYSANYKQQQQKGEIKEKEKKSENLKNLQNVKNVQQNNELVGQKIRKKKSIFSEIDHDKQIQGLNINSPDQKNKTKIVNQINKNNNLKSSFENLDAEFYNNKNSINQNDLQQNEKGQCMMQSDQTEKLRKIQNQKENKQQERLTIPNFNKHLVLQDSKNEIAEQIQQYRKRVLCTTDSKRPLQIVTYY
ncbi:hypothetical protein PPERSA_02042 [Pseudocohnilembus persalinus]|uniref:Uncharacterized protein n=1 Tax=Pseudocohnilembus persalinus TaxID=266149 RepID=A0A0V0QF74_PSEPJ|nr:hypothetical protein PPERSA_02042 [Pseudocohnilembus persalinus]|eukprot:KRX00863.1 hypothetical protein PPERSA_02042 [Pseudocohnilembus persalinus]